MVSLASEVVLKSLRALVAQALVLAWLALCPLCPSAEVYALSSGLASKAPTMAMVLQREGATVRKTQNLLEKQT